MLLETLYTLLKQALGEDYTVEEVESLTRKQVISLIDTDDFTENLLKNAKKLLIKDLKVKKKEDNVLVIDQKIKSKFPNAEYEVGEIDGKEYVVVWLEGKPEEVTD